MSEHESVWYAQVRDYTERLVRVRAFSPTRDEQIVASAILELLTDGELASAFAEVGLAAIEHDPFDRQNVYAVVEGERSDTIVLLGHFDTVDTADYGPLERWATDPQGLAERAGDLADLTPGLAADLATHPGDWMLGRGSVDMKSGVAANLALIRRLAEGAREGRRPSVTVVFLATPDEENESAGVLAGVHLLLRLRRERGLRYLGAINTDYTTPEHPGDTRRYVHTGTVGKLLPSFFVVGREGHVGQPFNGVDANLLAAELIRDLSMCDDLCDRVRGQVTPPPVTLRASDLKARYDVQLPFAAYFYLNVLTFTTDPADLMERLQLHAEAALARVLERLDETERRWRGVRRDAPHVSAPRGGAVWTYAKLLQQTTEQIGPARLRRELAAEWDQWPATLDKRERSLHLVRRLWTLSGETGPAVVLYYSPPYYPHAAATTGPLREAVRALVEAHADIALTEREYYPYISDMSYLRLDAAVHTAALTANMPVWEEWAADRPSRAGAYALPLTAIRELDLPVVNLGVYGRGAHQRGEAVLMSYSFGMLPQLIWEVVERLGRSDERDPD
jgi:arginine utilization protein RocB